MIIDELLVFSDHHAHPFPYGAKEVLHNGVLTNSRLLESVGVLDQMHKYATDKGIETVVFGGDLFHTRESVSTDAYNLTLEAMAQLLYQRKSFLLTGNHDYHDRAGLVHSLEGFKHWSEYDLRVVDWRRNPFAYNTGVRGDRYNLCFVPYTENHDEAVKCIEEHAEREDDGPKLLFAHLGMQGATVGSDYVLINDSDIAVDDVPFEKFAGCLFGHYHQHQKLFSNGWYIGASHQHTWGDVNTKRGFLHVRLYTDHIDFSFIESEAPRFLALRESDLDETVIREKDFVKVFTEKRLTPEATGKVRQRIKAENSEVIYVPPDIKLKTIDLDEKHLTPSAMVETWVKANEAWLKEHLPGVEHDELVEYGRTILAKVQGNG